MTAVLRPCPWPMEQILPHAPPMLLLDAVQGFDDSRVRAVAVVDRRNPFVTERGLAAHVGIELMAQACGAWVGANALASGGAVRLGFLLGTRRYAATLDFFPPGSRLMVEAAVVFQDQGMGVFDCSITCGEVEEAATAQLSLFRPESDEDMLRAIRGNA